MRHKLAMIADGKIAGAQLQKLVMAQEEFVKKVRHAPPLSPLEASDREDELGDWLDEHGITGGWELAPGLRRRRAGASTTWRRCTPRPTTTTLEGAIRWLAYTVETESLLREITDATTPHLRPGAGGQAVLADGPRARTGRSTCTRAWTPPW